jgi:ABC-type microcin C transport system duplicated ATPase subunit YejF
MVYQDPMTSLDPMIRIGPQVAEGLRAHSVGKDEATERARQALIEVGSPTPHASSACKRMSCRRGGSAS